MRFEVQAVPQMHFFNTLFSGFSIAIRRSAVSAEALREVSASWSRVERSVVTWVRVWMNVRTWAEAMIATPKSPIATNNSTRETPNSVCMTSRFKNHPFRILSRFHCSFR